MKRRDLFPIPSRRLHDFAAILDKLQSCDNDSHRKIFEEWLGVVYDNNELTTDEYVTAKAVLYSKFSEG